MPHLNKKIVLLLLACCPPYAFAAKMPEEKKEVPTITIFINNGQSHVSFNVNPNDTIQSIKNQIWYEYGLELKNQSLTFKEKKLYDDDTVTKKGIKQGSILKLEHCQRRLDTAPAFIPDFLMGGAVVGAALGSVAFHAAKLDANNKQALTPKAPKWHVINNGLNFECICEGLMTSGEACPAFGKIVWIHQGMGKVHLPHQCAKLTCPICHQKIKHVLTCGFHFCSYHIAFLENQQTEIQTIQGKHDNKKGMFKFKIGDDNLKYKWIKITTEVIKVRNNQEKTEDYCLIQ